MSKRHYRLTLADALAAHKSALEQGGGADGISNLSLVLSAIERPYTGYDLSIAKKAAALVESMATNHGFTDGNKRTTVILLWILLDRSGYDLQSVGDEDINAAIEQVVLGAAKREMKKASLHKWLALRIKKKD